MKKTDKIKENLVVEAKLLAVEHPSKDCRSFANNVEEFIENNDFGIDKATLVYIKKLEKALLDLTDGESWEDIQHYTGLSDERCKQIKDFAFGIWRMK